MRNGRQWDRGTHRRHRLSTVSFDYLVIGSGLSGATIARTLHDCGWRVLVVERRGHVGGNVHDHTHPSGIRVHTYGPHYFRTSSEATWSFVNRFSSFYKYEARLRTLVDGRYEQWPVSAEYIARAVGAAWQPGFSGEPSNFEEASLAMMPYVVYDKFIRTYSEKQWGAPPRDICASLVRRFDVRADGDDRLSRHRYQGLPTAGYAGWMASMLAGIPVLLNCDYLAERDTLRCRRRVIYTGPIDEYFDCCFGQLRYRGQAREHLYTDDAACVQPHGQVNNPDPRGGPHIRSIEWKYMMEPRFASKITGSVITRETTITPTDPDRYEYPFPDDANRQRYAQYRRLASGCHDVLICGRLGEYRYYDMDQAIARARYLVRQLLNGNASAPSLAVPERQTEQRA